MRFEALSCPQFRADWRLEWNLGIGPAQIRDIWEGMKPEGPYWARRVH
jgi:hypothetical protein